MTAIDSTRTAFGSNAAAPSLSKRIRTLFDTVVSWNDARMTHKALTSLSDRELADIGLSRGDIDTVARTDFIR